MLAPRDNTNRNEPLLARHARWVHQRVRKSFRLAYLKGMNQEHAVAILQPAHERRAEGLGSEGSGDVLSALAIEDMRRGIHKAYLRRAANILLAAAAVVVLCVYVGIVQLSRHTDDLKHAYIVYRGMPEITPHAVIRDVAKKAGVSAKEGLRGWLQKKLAKKDPANKPTEE